MRIAYLVGGIGRTGGNVVLFNHMESLAREGHEVQIVSPFGVAKWEEGFLQANPISAERRTYKGLWGPIRAIQENIRGRYPKIGEKITAIWRGDIMSYHAMITKKIVDNWVDSDITIATHSYTAYAAALLSDRTQAYYHMQGYEPWFINDPYHLKLSSLSYRLPLSKIANCRWLQTKIEALCGEKVGLVRPGLNHSIFCPQANQVKRRSERPNDEIVIVSYADRRPLKGWAESIEAMQGVFKTLEGSYKIHWRVFGNVNEKVDVPVEFLGFLSHERLAEVYSDADIFFLPSWFESFPLQPTEAMACGATVVTTEIGTEDFAAHEETALVIPPRNPAALSESLIRLIRDRQLQERLRVNGIAVARNFTWERSAFELKNALGLSK